MNAVVRLEEARELLQAGLPGSARRRLPARGSVPAAFRPERDLLEAEALRGQGYFGRSEVVYRRLLKLGRVKQPEVWLEAALGSAAGLRSIGASAAASKLLKAAAGFARNVGARWALERIELESALVDRAAGRYRAARKALGRRLKRALKDGAHQEASFLYWAIAGALRFEGSFAESETAFLRSLAEGKRAQDPSAQGYALFGLGGVTRIRGRLDDSRGWYAQALKAFAPTEDVFAKAYAQCGLANALRQLGRLSEAETHYRRSWKLYASLGDFVDLAYVDWGLGKIALAKGRLAEAEKQFKRATQGFGPYREERGLALSRFSLAQTLHARGKTREAEKLFDRAVKEGRVAGLHAHLEVFT